MRDVLVVDDDFMVAEIHRRFTERVPGFRVVEVARTGAEALAQTTARQPDLILLAVDLPDMTGLEVLQRLRSEGIGVGVIMITAARESDTVAGALHGGAADYLIKPFEFAQFEAKLTAFAAREDALRASGGADQSLIDTLFGNRAGQGSAPPLPKGLGADTARLVLTAARAAGELSAAECAEKVGISRVSARRYLEHFLAVGDLELRLQYGAGRPERRYRCPTR
jgi:response regulator of citrate/malate metabolism